MMVCLGAAIVPAMVLFLDAPLAFGTLLGLNNVVPAGAGPVAALLILATGVYQPATLLLSYADASRLIIRFTLFALPGCLVFAGVIFAVRPDAIATLWIYLVYVTVASILAIVFGLQLIRRSAF